MKILILMIATSFYASNSNATIQVSDLGVKLNFKESRNFQLDASVTKTSVGTCDGKTYSDLASLEGCQTNYRANHAEFSGNMNNVAANPSRPISFSSMPSIR